jgi:hypothetical protein
MKKQKQNKKKKKKKNTNTNKKKSIPSDRERESSSLPTSRPESTASLLLLCHEWPFVGVSQVRSWSLCAILSTFGEKCPGFSKNRKLIFEYPHEGPCVEFLDLLAPWAFEYPGPGSFNATFLSHRTRDVACDQTGNGDFQYFDKILEVTNQHARGE